MSNSTFADAILHYAPRLEARGIHPVDLLLRADGSKEVARGDRVSWQWSGGRGTGKVRKTYTSAVTRTPEGAKVKRNGSEKNPALVITPDNGGKTVVKLASEVRLEQRTDARKCSPPWRGTLGSCTRGAEASSKRSIKNIARGGKMTPERKARQAKIAKLKSKDRSMSLKDLEKSEQMLENSARKLGIELPKFDPSNVPSLEDLFKEADRVGSKYQDKPMTPEEKKKAKKEADSIVNQEILAGEAMGRAKKQRDKDNSDPIRKAVEQLKSSMGKTDAKLKKMQLRAFEGMEPKTLREAAKKAKIKGRSKMTKKQLAKALVDNGVKVGSTKKRTMEEELKFEAKARSTAKQEVLASIAKGSIKDLRKLGGKATNESKRRKQAALTKNAIRKFNRRADAMGWSTTVRMDAIAYLLEVLG